MLVLSLLLHHTGQKPALALLISPWVTLVSRDDVRTESDYLDMAQLGQYGRLFAVSRVSIDDPLVSPGCCKDGSWWKRVSLVRVSPVRGFFISYGAEEVLASETEDLVDTLNGANVTVETRKELRWHPCISATERTSD
jgi:acetyl esterase/lipase